MDDAEVPEVLAQRQPVEPAQMVLPLAGMVGEGRQGLLDQLAMARRVFAYPGLAGAGQRRGVPGQGIEFVIAEDAVGMAAFDHGPHPAQGAADARAAIDQVTEKDRLALGVLPDAVHLLIIKTLQQQVQGMGAAVEIADQIVAQGHQSSPSRLPQPSLVRQIS